jgi:hypothetical protein
VLPISWDFFTITDQMTVYDGTNITPADVIFDTGVVSNTGSANIPFTTISGGLTIIMNQTNVPGSGDAWNYSIGSASNNFLYLAFTEDTNLTTTPIKFAPLPFVPTGASNLFYQPEQDISALNGQSAAGTWTLEIQDDRAGAGLTNLLLGWQLEFTFANTNFIPSTNTPTIVTNGIGPVTNVVPANGVSIFQVNVPTNADFATNILIFADAPLNLWWSTNLPATITNLNDFLLITNSTGGSSVLSTNSSPPLIPGGTYYLILQNTNSFDVTNAFEVGFHLLITFISPTNGVPITNSIGAGSLVWYEIDVPTNADWATNILLFADAPLNIWFSTNQPPTITNLNDVILIPNATNGISILGTNTAPTNIVMGGIYYLGVQNTNSFAVTNYAIEVDFHFITNNVASTNIVFSGIIYTNIGGTNGFLLIWFAPTNDIFQVQESDTLPPVWNTFTNIITYTGPPTPTNGMFTFFDDGSQYPFGPMRFYQLILLQATNTLTLPSQTNFTANVGIPLVVTNTATDSNPALTLSYFFTNFPATSTTASIDTNGIISWTPGAADASSAFKFTTVVTDSGLPPLSATNSFTVFVLPYPAISNVVVTVTNVTLQWTAPTNDLFLVEWTTNLSPAVWTPFPPPPITSTTGIFTFIDTNAPTAMKFYRLDWLPLP